MELSDNEHPAIQYEPTAIYLGCRISDINAKILKGIAEARNIPLYKMEIVNNDTSYMLNPVRLM